MPTSKYDIIKNHGGLFDLPELPACHHEIDIEETLIFGQLNRAKEVFLTSTTKGIVPVCAIDGHPVGSGRPGVVTQHLAQLLADLSADFIISKPDFGH